MLKRCYGGTQSRKHKPLKEFDSGKYIAGSVRNPWSWHVSLWAFGCSGRGGLQGKLCRRPPIWVSRETVALWNDVYADPEDAGRFRRWLKMIYAPEWQRYLREGLHKTPLGASCGLLTFRYCSLHTKGFKTRSVRAALDSHEALVAFEKEHNILDGVIRNEHLEEDLLRVLEAAGHVVADEVREKIYEGRGKKKNQSRHRPTAYYYDDETTALVAARERFIIEKFDYQGVPGAVAGG
jgi:hypothetical protein